MTTAATYTNIRAIVTDIEGTTSSISFVKDVLFPYAAKHLPDFVAQNEHDPDVAKQLDQVAQDTGIERSDLNALINQLLEWIEQDVKATPLKTLQGLIWEAGYKQGDYQAHMYADATKSLRDWHQQGIPLFVYSSGSVYAQKLFFGYSQDGNLLPLLNGHFDTSIGHKQQVESYQAIQLFLDIPAERILFLSDISGELDAARQAGYQTCHLLRDEADDLAQSQHAAVRSFADIQLN